ncbi:extracellular solute-binding protein [Demequina sp. SYSU T00039]|uniref:Extracellular solute-binding protein n=1 Tax=Demequina lignilytica TaxID=3051663 RepID=A0AAW7M0J8_9MICO|nr:MULTISPECIES: extracellular solute-binding protein [unclassified Demequina]MDN4477919.1 extracellular solute-binding protein [Demequina sp. SYSU T00039-1]MDN4487828.1 extracellular solute-binding protein [Demequina sp. SYSU T00039]MDN4490789.1 extracellular solute-binding protein [Demequina sp. SYSU T00068]
MMTLTFARPFRAAALAGAGALALAACSSAVGDTPEDGGTVDGSSISISVPATEAGVNPHVEFAERYMAEFPDRTVEVVELPGDGYANSTRTQLQAGNAADLIYVTPGAGNPQSLLPFAEAGFLESLSGTSAESTVPASSAALFGSDGEIYAQGLDLTVIASVANDTAMAAAGYALPDDFGALLASCADVQADDASVYVIAGTAVPNTGLLGISLAGARVYAEDPDWNMRRAAGEVTFADTAAWHDTLEAVIELQEAGCFQDGAEGGDFGTITVGLGQGTSYAAFIPSGAAEQLATETGSEFSLHALPGATAESTTVYASVNNALALTSGSKNKAAALAFLDWMAQPENLAAYGETSGNLPVGDLDPADLPAAYAPIADFIAEADYLPLPNQSWSSGEVYNALGAGIQGLLTGQTTVEDVLAAMDAAWDK